MSSPSKENLGPNSATHGSGPYQNRQQGSKNDCAAEDAAASTNVFDLSRLRLSQNFAEAVGGKQVIATVPVRRPHRQWWVRVRAGDDWQLLTAVLDLKEEQEQYLIDRSIWPAMPGEIVPKILFAAINRQNVPFIWPVRLPRTDGRRDAWSQSELEAVRHASEHWTRVAANMSLGAYEIFTATAALPQPEWPGLTFRQMLEIAFRDRYISDPDHAVLRKLRGEL